MAVVNLTLADNISIDDLLDTIRDLVGKAGCPGCGLNGFDLRLAVDPWERIRSVIDLPFVKDIAVNPTLDNAAVGGFRQQFVQ